MESFFFGGRGGVPPAKTGRGDGQDGESKAEFVPQIDRWVSLRPAHIYFNVAVPCDKTNRDILVLHKRIVGSGQTIILQDCYLLSSCPCISHVGSTACNFKTKSYFENDK
mmetsp:Transcript_35803/g.83410  ORF Transcript_35803/g.83410 Transcript_35803/m.83410 type:complete len:110 (-) Transcript_35803:26-355(-)